VKPVLLLLHVGASLEPSYSAALGADGRSWVLGSGSGAYDEITGLAARYPTLRAFLSAEVPEWQPGTPLVLVCWSAGCWAPRAWMKNESDREAVTALVLLDGLHSGLSLAGKCKPDAVDGIVAYGRLAASQPAAHLLVLTHTEIIPPGYASTTLCAELVEQSLSSSGSVIIQGYPGADAAAHVRQVKEVGPAIMQDIVEPQLAGTRSTSTGLVRKLGLAVAAFGLVCAAYIIVR
jgi:hypothetical protein